MARHNDIGQWGEQLAREYLIANGYAIYDRNIRTGHNEIDIIAFKEDTIAFVEVKTRTTNFSDPLDAIDAKKIKRLARAADSFLRTHQIRHEPRFDVITIVGTPPPSLCDSSSLSTQATQPPILTHYPDAFLPPLSGAH